MSTNINPQYNSSLSYLAGDILHSIESEKKTSQKPTVQLNDAQSAKLMQYLKGFSQLNSVDKKAEALPFKAVMVALKNVDSLPLELKVMVKTMKAYEATLGRLEDFKHHSNQPEVLAVSQTLIQNREKFLSLFESLRKIDPEKLIDRFQAVPQGPKQPLNEIEQLAVYAYTTSLYKPMNAILSNNPKYLDDFLTESLKLTDAQQKEKASETVSELISLTQSALNKLPDHQTSLFRGAGLTKEQLNQYQKGESLTIPKFSSASSSPDAAIEFMHKEGRKANRTPVLFQIQSETGKEISSYSVKKDESETLFLPFSEFEVLDRKEEMGIVIIQLKQTVS